MAGYLSAAGIESVIQIIQGAFSDICQLIVLPEQSVEHRTCRALKIGKGGGNAKRRAVRRWSARPRAGSPGSSRQLGLQPLHRIYQRDRSDVRSEILRCV